MTVIHFDVFEAFKAAGIPEANARKAAEALSEAFTTQKDMADLESDVKDIKGQITTIKTDLATVKTDLAVLKWGIGLTAAGVFGLVLKAFAGF